MQVVQYLIYQGFYVNLDFHSIGMHQTLVTGNTPFSGADDISLYDVDGWVNLWWVCLDPAWGLLSGNRVLRLFACFPKCYITLSPSQSLTSCWHCCRRINFNLLDKVF
jgi:hypothetical protein